MLPFFQLILGFGKRGQLMAIVAIAVFIQNHHQIVGNLNYVHGYAPWDSGLVCPYTHEP